MPNPPKKHLVIFQPSGRRGEVPEGDILLDAARDLGVEIESICAGQQTCGKCKILVEEGNFQKYGVQSSSDHLSPMGESERDYWERRKIQGDYRLSCAARVHGPLVITVPEESQARKQIVRKSATERVIELDPAIRQYYVKVTPSTLGDERGDWELLQAALDEQFGLTGLSIDLPALRTLQDTQRAGKWAVTVTVWDDREVVRVQPGYAEGTYGLAVDIGTTTVAAHLCDLRTGAVLATESMMNPQVPFGEDILSRISYLQSRGDGLERLNTAIVEGLNKLARRAARSAGISPLSATLMRMIVAAAVIWGFALLRGRAGRTLRVLSDRQASLAILGGAIAGPFLGVWLSLVAVNLTEVGIAATLMALSPIFLLLPSNWIFNERISLQSVVGTLIAIGGVALIFLW